jgi:hypothetical protein
MFVARRLVFGQVGVGWAGGSVVEGLWSGGLRDG